MKHIRITKRQPSTCLVCPSTDTIFSVAFRDTDNPVYHHCNHGSIPSPNDSALACKDHLAEVTAIVLKRNGLIGDGD